jgi:hypothetical protein
VSAKIIIQFQLNFNGYIKAFYSARLHSLVTKGVEFLTWWHIVLCQNCEQWRFSYLFSQLMNQIVNHLSNSLVISLRVYDVVKEGLFHLFSWDLYGEVFAVLSSNITVSASAVPLLYILSMSIHFYSPVHNSDVNSSFNSPICILLRTCKFLYSLIL